MALDKVPHRREQYDPAEHGTIPIHRRGSNRLRRREETKNEEGEEEAQGDGVDTHAPAAK